MNWPALVLAVVITAPTLAQERPSSPRAEGRNAQGQQTLRKTTPEPFQLGIPAPTPRAALAPVPDRNIEGPRERISNAPSVEPMLLPPERRAGVTFGREHLRDTGTVDRPFDMIVPGARLRIPFEGNTPAR